MKTDTQIFEAFENGTLLVEGKSVHLREIDWWNHPKFEGVALKHLITSAQSQGSFSFHLVRISPHKAIQTHVHENELETHEVISGSGYCIKEGSTFSYTTGTMSIFPKKTKHSIHADAKGLYLLAKFFPALC
ncbi:MAG: cupin domain-containing protein [Epsilonproteobacteria bacterium]|nr:cupin domain-containing protein [Campylobacterota bacterium]